NRASGCRPDLPFHREKFSGPVCRLEALENGQLLLPQVIHDGRLPARLLVQGLLRCASSLNSHSTVSCSRSYSNTGHIRGDVTLWRFKRIFENRFLDSGINTTRNVKCPERPDAVKN